MAKSKIESDFIFRYNVKMRTGIATVPLDYGRCPKWLFERMRRLSRGILIAIVSEYGNAELLKRLSNPVWFQSLGCVLGFDWNSSGLTTTTMGALKAGISGLEKELGIFICGGKGKRSRQTPQEIEHWAELIDYKQPQRLIYASRICAKVDSSLIQAGFPIYQHNFIFTRDGEFAVVQQGMNIEIQKARRFHWLSSKIKDFTIEPHAGIVADIKLNPLNLVAKESMKNKEISLEMVRESPKELIKNLDRICDKINYCELELKDREFFWHPLLKERFDIKRLRRTIEKAHFLKPDTFENLLMTEGVGPKTIRAISLVAEVIYGAKASFEDPARYSFAHGGKDGTPYFVDKETLDKTIQIIEKGIEIAHISLKEKDLSKKRLWSQVNLLKEEGLRLDKDKIGERR